MNGAKPSLLLVLVPLLSTVAYTWNERSFMYTVLFTLPVLLPILINYTPSWTQFRRTVSTMFRAKTNTVDFTSRIRLNDWTHNPDAIVRTFCTILWEWNRCNKTVNCKTLMEDTFGWGNCEDGAPKSQLPLFIDDLETPFWNIDQPDIQYRMWVSRNPDRDNVIHSEIFLKISFINATAKPQTVVNHIEYIRTTAKRIIEARTKKQMVLVSTVPAIGKECSTMLNFMLYEFSTTSSFANFFCEEARTVENDIYHFLKSRDSYKRHGRPWTYTVLNEGPPGVGKTKLVKAIAELTKRTLIVIHLNHMTNVQILNDAFHSTILAGEHVPHDQRLYYIPEVDTQLSDILKTREPCEQPCEQPCKQPCEPQTKTSIGPEKYPMQFKKLTLGEILNVMDGIPERHGHITIMDTNHIDKLDPAFIRPGRVDRIVNWKKLSSESVRQYLSNVYDIVIADDVKLPDRVYTAAELQVYVSMYPIYNPEQLTNMPPPSSPHIII